MSNRLEAWTPLTPLVERLPRLIRAAPGGRYGDKAGHSGEKWIILVPMSKKTGASPRGALIKKAALIALIGNALLAALKIVAGVYADSLAVVGDGIDSWWMCLSL